MSKWGWATCPVCREPLISSFERRGKEFCCVACGRWWEFLQPVAAPDDTPGMQERYDELHALFKTGERGPIVAKATP